MKPVQVRQQLIEDLQFDLIGPDEDAELSGERLLQAPSRWYLTGFLVPVGAAESQRMDETAQDEIDGLDQDVGLDDGEAPEPASAKRVYFPSSIGLSLIVAPQARKARVTVSWGDYKRQGESRRDEAEDATGAAEDVSGDTGANQGSVWQRFPRRHELEVALPQEAQQHVELPLPESGGLQLALSVKRIAALAGAEEMFPHGARSVSLFLVNRRPPAPDMLRDEAFAFQAQLEVRLDVPLVARPNLRGLVSEDWDERVADLQYRDSFEFAVGHGVATAALIDPDGSCRGARTCWMPSAQVEHVAPAPIAGVELRMEVLAELAGADEADSQLSPLVRHYREWIEQQRGHLPDKPPARAETGQELLQRAETAARRIEAGIALLAEPDVLQAFRLANRVMAAAARQRFGVQQGRDPQSLDPPAWRPFQLAFLLMNLHGIVQGSHADRKVVDLLFFPTGGGKTEAYLGLAAFTLLLRRLHYPGIASAGVSVLMRYTLRLLTLDQLSRASTLICALELERQRDPQGLGEWPFEIGLWVGMAATPNRMGRKNDGDSYSARAKTIAFQNDDRRPSPIPLEECPWCGTKFKSTSFRLLPDTDHPTDLRIVCADRHCAFSRERALPILGVDEPIYRRLPCFLIATVDKFAAIPWVGEVGALFGRVDRHDQDGFYGPCHPGRGRPLDRQLQTPDLVVQDELHLISGPMGTMVGLYETALDELCTRLADGERIGPKIIASTATVRRAEKQIQALFNRRIVDVFPPPGPDLRDSFFARTHSPEESNARLFCGIAAQGRSLKVVLLRSYLALLGAAQKLHRQAGGNRNKRNPVDPYMTLLGYFNSLRELGGSRRIVEDEVTTRLTGYGGRKRINQQEGSFAGRKIAYEVVELTSRVSTDKVAEAKRRLALPFHEKGRVDVALATNMISVGLDITRLGLMVVLGQPKTSAEYIQATSRVGRDPERPGLVVTLLNIHRPRDRSHYERFQAYHQSFYRSVEATSVTPFSPRALDRGLAGTVVGLARHAHAPMTPAKGASNVVSERNILEFVADRIAARAADQASSRAEAQALRRKVRERVQDLLDSWEGIAADYLRDSVELQYQEEAGEARRLLYDFLSPELDALPSQQRKFRANRSMRDVEPSVNLWVKSLDNIDLEEEPL